MAFKEVFCEICFVCIVTVTLLLNSPVSASKNSSINSFPQENNSTLHSYNSTTKLLSKRSVQAVSRDGITEEHLLDTPTSTPTPQDALPDPATSESVGTMTKPAQAAMISCDVDASVECIAWQTELQSWQEAHATCRQLDGFLLHRALAKLPSPHKRRRPRYAREGCAFLCDKCIREYQLCDGIVDCPKAEDELICPPDDDHSFLLGHIRELTGTYSKLMWTGLTRHRGHYQWMTRVPSTDAAVNWSDEEEHPELASSDCVALSVEDKGVFRPVPCETTLPVACVLQPSLRGNSHQMNGLELRVTSESSVEPWIDVPTEQFSKLELHCGLFDSTSGKMVPMQGMEVFWVKDDVYLGVNSTNIHPVDIDNPTISEYTLLIAEGDIPRPTKQGTFSCEAWGPNTTGTIKSNSILVTMTEWDTYIITVANVSATLTPTGMLDSLALIYSDFFPNMNDMVKDMISTELEYVEEDTPMVTYKFRLYQEKMNGLEFWALHNLNFMLHVSFTDDSSFHHATECVWNDGMEDLSHNVILPNGMVETIHTDSKSCQGKNGGLFRGPCIPNFTDGAKFGPPPIGECEKPNVCPRGYVNVTFYCVLITKALPWRQGFEGAYITGQENDILDVDDGYYDRGHIYHSLRNILFTETNQNATWVSMRRMHKYGPLVSVENGTYDFHSQQGVSWLENHPLHDKECVGFNLISRKLFSAACNESFPFITVINMKKLNNAITSESGASRTGMVSNSNKRCSNSGSISMVSLAPTYGTGDHVCIFLIQKPPKNWVEAHEQCQFLGAHLPQPFLGFLNWMYKKLLIDIRSKALYINLGNVGSAVKIDDPRVEYEDWINATDFSNMYGILEKDGWALVNGEESRVQNILCERSEKNIERKEFVLTLAEGNVMKVDDDQMENIRPKTIRCFRNGKLVSLQRVSDHLQLNPETKLGYYKCLAWSANPTWLLESNTILLSDSPSGSILSVKIHYPRSAYIALVDDTTFWGNSSETDSYHRSLLEVIEKKFSISGVTLEKMFFAPSDSGGKYEYAHLKMNQGVQDSKCGDSCWLERLRTMSIPTETWAIEEIRSTSGCQENIFFEATSGLRLTFQRTNNSGEFLPQELCLDDEGAPVSRTCHGNFLEGYFWSETLSGGCNGSSTDVTKQLHDIQLNVKDYQSGTYSRLTADAESLLLADIHYIAVGLQKIAKEQISSTEDSEHFQLNDLVSTIDNILHSQEESYLNLNTRLNSTNILLESYERLLLGVSLNASDEDNSDSRDKSLMSTEVLGLTNDTSVVGYEDGEKNGGKIGYVLREGQSDAPSKAMVRIIIPQNLSREIASKSPTKTPLAFTAFRSGKLFNDLQSEKLNYILNSYVIQASYREEIQDLNQPVKIMFRPLHATNGSVCVFWDFKKNKGIGGWSRRGCRKNETGDDGEITTCYCNHLTNFALLINFDDVEFTANQKSALVIISLVGGILSILGLFYILVTSCRYKEYRKLLSDRILFHLSLAHLFSMVIIVASSLLTLDKIICRGAAALLHYSILVSFGWELVEGINMFWKFALLKFMHIDEHFDGFFRNAVGCAWGLPLIPVISLLAYDIVQYTEQGEVTGGTSICWISTNGFRYAFLPFLAFVVLVNLCLYTLTLRCAIMRIRTERKDRKAFRNTKKGSKSLIAELSMAVVEFFLLGLVWTFGILAITDARVVFAYLFTVCIAFHGILLLIIFVRRKRSTRAQTSVPWTRTKREYLGVAYTTTTDCSLSQNERSSSNGKSGLRAKSSAVYKSVVFGPRGKIVVASDGKEVFH